jgi:hypothetical protein
MIMRKAVISARTDYELYVRNSVSVRKYLEIAGIASEVTDATCVWVESGGIARMKYSYV